MHVDCTSHWRHCREGYFLCTHSLLLLKITSPSSLSHFIQRRKDRVFLPKKQTVFASELKIIWIPEQRQGHVCKSPECLTEEKEKRFSALHCNATQGLRASGWAHFPGLRQPSGSMGSSRWPLSSWHLPLPQNSVLGWLFTPTVCYRKANLNMPDICKLSWLRSHEKNSFLHSAVFKLLSVWSRLRLQPSSTSSSLKGRFYVLANNQGQGQHTQTFVRSCSRTVICRT